MTQTTDPSALPFAPMITTYERWPEVAELTASLHAQLGVRALIINDGGPLPPPDLAAQIEAVADIKTLPENRGSAAALNVGFAAMQTEYVLLMDSDDNITFDLDPAELAKCLVPDVIFLPTEIHLRDEVRTRTIPERPSRAHLRNNIIGTHSGMIIRRTLFEELGGSDTSLTSAKDWEFWIRAADAEVRFAAFPGRLHYNTDTVGISRDLHRVYEGRNQLWAKHPHVFTRSGRLYDLYLIIKYGVGNCARGGTVPEHARGDWTFKMLRQIHGVGRWLYERLVLSTKVS